MSNKEAIEVLTSHLHHWERLLQEKICSASEGEETINAINVAIGAIKRDSKVDDITFHWNDEKNNFVAACNAFEDILKVYGRGVSE